LLKGSKNTNNELGFIGVYHMKIAHCSKIALIVSIGLAMVMSGCSSSKPYSATSQKQQDLSDSTDNLWLADGSISITRKVPAISTSEKTFLLGFMPYQTDSSSIKVNLASNEIILKVTGQESVTAKFQTTTNLSAGSKQVVLVEEMPIWYANDVYFQDRDLAVPPAGAKDRYLKAILGDKAVHLSDGTILYSSEFELPNTQALRFDNSDLETLLKNLTVGATIEFK
jgi:hypothetical protein